jgi:hypothetical protein
LILNCPLGVLLFRANQLPDRASEQDGGLEPPSNAQVGNG